MITCALSDIQSLELNRRPLGPSALVNYYLSNSRDSISHSVHVIIAYPIRVKILKSTDMKYVT